MSKIRIGVIGCGVISDLTVCGYVEDERVEIVAVCDSDKDKAEAKAREWGAQKAVDDYRRILDDKDIDAVEIITPHDLHHPMAIDAAKAGKHVSVQKPMARNLPECREMIDAANDAGVVLRVNDPFLYYPPIVKAKELIESGEIGKPGMVRVRTTVGSMECGWSVDASAWARGKSGASGDTNPSGRARPTANRQRWRRIVPIVVAPSCLEPRRERRGELLPVGLVHGRDPRLIDAEHGLLGDPVVECDTPRLGVVVEGSAADAVVQVHRLVADGQCEV